MSVSIKSLVKKGFDLFGYEVRKIGGDTGKNPFEDIAEYMVEEPTLFDVGANVGQTVNILLRYFPKGHIYAFEPNKHTFRALKKSVSAFSQVRAFNFGMGSDSGNKKFYENSDSPMSSFLELDKQGWGNEKLSTALLDTVDEFCETHRITRIDLLKIDTQGYEMEVFQGAHQMFLEKRIRMIYFEVIFNRMYKDLPSVGDLFNFLAQNGFQLVSLYDMHHTNKLACYCNILFIHKDHLKN